MMICRYLNNDRMPKPLHVHDEPAYYADIQRHEEMGWTMARKCQYPDLPFVSGDPQARPVAIRDLTLQS